MGIFDRFPYSSTHEMNLDFMLGKATEIAESLQEIDTHTEQAEQAATNAAQSAQSAAQSAQAAAGSQTAAGTSASQSAQHKADAEDAADRAEAASNLADEAVEQAQAAVTQAQTAATNAGTAADGAIASAAAAETRINTLAASLPEDFTDLNNDVNALKIALEHTVTLHPVWERGNINNSGNNSNSTRYVRSASQIKVNSESIHVEFDGSYSSSPLYTVYIYNGSGTFQSSVSKTASADISITPGYYVRFLIEAGRQDTETVIDVDSAVSYLVATAVELYDVEPDKTLTLADRPAESKAVGDKFAEMCTKIVQMEWTRGNISTSSGTNTSSSSTNRIRTAYKYQINEDKIHLSIPAGMKVGLYKYTQIYGINFDSYAGEFYGESDVSVTPETFIRLVAFNTDDSDLPTSAGDAVIISYSSDVQTFFNEYNRRNLAGFSCLSMFETVGVIGDSWASGSIHFPDGTYSETYYNMSWVQILARKFGFTASNFSKGGLSTKTWLTDATYGLSALLADTPKNLYIINLGINDNTQIEAGTLNLGTIADVNVSDFTQNPDTFYGNYGRIIGNIKRHAPKAIIIAVSVLRPGERNMDAYIKQIADTYEIPFIQASDDEYFMSGYFFRSIYGGHMSAFGYSGIANAMERLIQKCIIENPLKFGYYDGTTE